MAVVSTIINRGEEPDPPTTSHGGVAKLVVVVAVAVTATAMFIGREEFLAWFGF